MHELGKFGFKINVIRNGLENYMSFNISIMLIFINSFQCLSCTLDSLVKNMAKADFKYLSQEFDSNVLDLVKRKGFYAYEHMSGYKKFEEKLPSKEKFYSSLTDILKIWNTFEMKTMKDYDDFYLKRDVLLLADFSEKFRNISLKNCGLRQSHYAMLNMTKIELELISDADMYLFFEKGMRGGISYISKRYSKAKNNYLKSYDLKQESNGYLDTNNLDGYVMFKFLPTSQFKWIDSEECDSNKYSSNSSKNCVLVVDLEYPKELRELPNYLPLAPCKIETIKEILSNYQLKIADFIIFLLVLLKNWYLTF